MWTNKQSAVVEAKQEAIRIAGRTHQVPTKLVITAENAGKHDTLGADGPLEPSTALLDKVEANGTPLDMVGEGGMTLAHAACRGGSLFNLEYLLKRHPSLLHARDDVGRSLLHTATEHRQNHIAQELVRRDPGLLHILDSFGRTPSALASLVDGSRSKLSHWLTLAGIPATSLVDEIRDHIGQPDSNLLPGWVSPLANGLHRLLYEELWERSLWLSSASSRRRREGRPSEANFMVKSLVLTTNEADATQFEVLGLCELPVTDKKTNEVAIANSSTAAGAWMGSVSIKVYWDIETDKWAIEEAQNRITQVRSPLGARACLTDDGVCSTCGVSIATGHWLSHKAHCDRISMAEEDVKRCEEEMVSIHYQMESKKKELCRMGKKMDEHRRARLDLLDRLHKRELRKDPRPTSVAQAKQDLEAFDERMALDQHACDAMNEQLGILEGRFHPNPNPNPNPN